MEPVWWVVVGYVCCLLQEAAGLWMWTKVRERIR